MFRKFLVVLFVLAWISGPAPVRAAPQGATIVVNSDADTIQNDGWCTLREALLAANTDTPVGGCTAGSGADLILLPAGEYTLSLTGIHEDEGLTGDLDIFSSLTLRGDGQEQTFIDAALIDRGFDILPGAHTVSLEDFTLRRGGFEDYEYDGPEYGAGLRNQAELELLRVSVLNSHSPDFGPLIYGVGIYNSGTLTLLNSSVTGSRAVRGYGGGIYNSGEMTLLSSNVNNNEMEIWSGGGIYNTGSALIKDSSLDGNRLSIYEAEAPGGNIFNSGTFTCENCSIQGGVGFPGAVIATGGTMTLVDTIVGGGATRWGFGSEIDAGGSLTLMRTRVYGGLRGIYGAGRLTMIDSEIYNAYATSFMNFPDYGGGALYFNGTVFISGSHFHDNKAGLRGGAILGSGQWTIRDSAFVGNLATNYSPDWEARFDYGRGGAIYWTSGVLTVTNTTFSGNQSTEGGAGIYVEGGEVRLNSVTMTNNRTHDHSGSGGLALYDGKAVLFNTIIAGNHEYKTPDCYQVSYDPAEDYYPHSELVSLGYNFIGAVNGCQITPAAGDQFGGGSDWIWPLLAPLADNGGRTPTHALLPDSPVLDAGPVQGCPLTDQRGIPRPQGAACDIGAFEQEQAGSSLQVAIDIRPGASGNQINPNSQASVPVAILSAPGFSAPEQVDPASLTFGRTGTEDSLEWVGSGGTRPSCQARDANKDRLLDLVCHFKVSRMGFYPGDVSGSLRGLTLTGQPIHGQDTVSIRYPTSRQQDSEDTLLDQQAYLGDVLLWLPLLP